MSFIHINIYLRKEEDMILIQLHVILNRVLLKNVQNVQQHMALTWKKKISYFNLKDFVYIPKAFWELY